MLLAGHPASRDRKGYLGPTASAPKLNSGLVNSWLWKELRLSWLPRKF